MLTEKKKFLKNQVFAKIMNKKQITLAELDIVKMQKFPKNSETNAAKFDLNSSMLKLLIKKGRLFKIKITERNEKDNSKTAFNSISI